MKHILVLLVTLFLIPAAFAQNTPAIALKKATHDFGEIKEGPKVSHVFEFTNTGKAPLILTNVEASCGCTTPEWPKEPIMPGQTSKITVEYETKGRPGKFNKRVTIKSNAADETHLFIIGDVQVAEGRQVQQQHNHNHDHDHAAPATPAKPNTINPQAQPSGNRPY